MEKCYYVQQCMRRRIAAIYFRVTRFYSSPATQPQPQPHCYTAARREPLQCVIVLSARRSGALWFLINHLSSFCLCVLCETPRGIRVGLYLPRRCGSSLPVMVRQMGPGVTCTPMLPQPPCLSVGGFFVFFFFAKIEREKFIGAKLSL